MKLLKRLLIACFFTALCWSLRHPRATERLNMDTVALDGMFNFEQWWMSNEQRESRRPSEVVLIAMDEPSYQTLGIPLNSAWPRATHGRLLQKLSELGAKRAVFDVLFLDEGPNPEDDFELADGFAAMSSVIGAQYTIVPYETAAGVLEVEQLLEPYYLFLEEVERIGLVGYQLEGENVRHFFFNPRDSTEDLLSLDMAGVVDLIPHEDRPKPADYIRYYGPPGTVPTYSYYQILEEESPFPKELIEGKVCVIALRLRTGTGPMQKDDFATPFFNTRMYGGEIHASAMANLLRNDWIRSMDFRRALLIELAITFVGTTTIFYLSPLVNMALLVTTVLGWTLASYIGFSSNLVFPGATAMLLVLPSAVLADTIISYYLSRKEQQKIQRAFASYVPPQMATELAKEGYNLELGGRRVLASAMFTDIASFTSISESLEPEEVADMLNAYFTEMGTTIFENNGTLIKFIGDAVFVIWGAPVNFDDHADRALNTAIEATKKLEQFNKDYDWPHLHTRIGVHTGMMVAGNLGTDWRFDYTAIGDSVNLAARVEGINKYLGTTVLITGDTLEALVKKPDVLPMGSVRVVGKELAVPLFTPFLHGISDEHRTTWINAMESFKNKNWEGARKLFEEVKEKVEFLRTASSLYLKNISMYESEPPEEGWDGELVFSSK